MVQLQCLLRRRAEQPGSWGMVACKTKTQLLGLILGFLVLLLALYSYKQLASHKHSQACP